MPLRYLTAGESHGPALIAILDGFPAGMVVNIKKLNLDLSRRQRGYGSGPRMKIEQDQAQIISGIMAGQTTGAPIAVSIINLNHDRWQGIEIEPYTTPRPGHVDLAAAVKYGYRDLRPGLERSSARETAARVVLGALCKQYLDIFEIEVFGYVKSIGAIEADLTNIDYKERFITAEQNDVRSPTNQAAELMRSEIRKAIEAKDTLGGVIEIIALGLPPGLGSHTQWDRRLEAKLGAAILSVQAIKGLEIGDGFATTRLRGTQVHDPIKLDNDKLIRPTNRNGGIEGGISTGQPLLIRAAMKPIATTLSPQETVDLRTGQEVDTRYERSDFCPVPRAVPILEAVTAVVLADALIEKLGGDSITEMIPRYEALRQARLPDLPMDPNPHLYWPK